MTITKKMRSVAVFGYNRVGRKRSDGGRRIRWRAEDEGDDGWMMDEAMQKAAMTSGVRALLLAGLAWVSLGELVVKGRRVGVGLLN